MKKLIYILILTTTIVSCVSLEEDPRSKISSENFYKTESDASAAVTAAYSKLTHNYTSVAYGLNNSGFPFLNRTPEITYGSASDDYVTGPSAPDPDFRANCGLYTNSSNAKVLELWRQNWEIINDANIAIYHIPKITGDTATLNNYVREAKFLRALGYFYAVRLWGKIPLLTTPTESLSDNLTPAQADTSAIYAQIIKDFTDATALPNKRNTYHATSGAAHAFLLKVALTRRDWNEVVRQYTIINGLGLYSVSANYKDIFDPSKKDKEEHIFDAYFLADNTTGGLGNTNLMAKDNPPPYGYIKNGVKVNVKGGENPTANVTIRQYFKPNDQRTAFTFIDSVKATSTATTYIVSAHYNKWNPITWTPSLTSFQNSGVNIPVIRYAEVVLSYVEAQNELNNKAEAVTVFNNFRAKRSVTGKPLPKIISSVDKDNFRDSIFLERRIDFASENSVRWFDLVRQNGSGTSLIYKAIPQLIDPVLGNPTDYWCQTKAANFALSLAKNPKKFLLWPIPLTELQANPNLVQNPGWE